MARFLIRRILLGLLVIWFTVTLVYIIFFIGPGPQDVARRLAGREATQQQITAQLRRLHLDAAWYKVYWNFIWNELLHGRLYSYIHGQSVFTVIKEAFPLTLTLTIGAALIWVVLGVLSGVLSAVRRGSIWDRLATMSALFFYSTPVFVLGLMLLFFLYYLPAVHANIHLLPGQGAQSVPHNPITLVKYFALPWIALALISAATYTRLTRGSMLEVMGEDYIRTARSKGLLERRVIYRHALRSALTPVVSQFGIDVGTLLGGAILTETVFGIPGLGWTVVKAIEYSDLPVIIGIVVVATTAVVVANILVDVFYAVLDPRVRLH